MKKNHIDLETTKSNHQGLVGLFETLLRKFKIATHLVTMVPVYLFACFVLGCGLFVPVMIFKSMLFVTQDMNFYTQSFILAMSLAVSYFSYGISLVFVAPLTNWLLRTNLKAWRGPYYSAESLKWFIHNGLTYLVRFSFLEFITPSPLALLFYKMLGMKIGSGVTINSTWISDPSMIELGDKVTIGGSVTLLAHYGQGGLLVLAPVTIGDRCTIGIKATIMGGCTVGADAKILPHSVLLPNTHVPAGETWGGVPAQKMDIRAFYKAQKTEIPKAVA